MIQAAYRVPIEGVERPIERVVAIEVDAPGNEDLAAMTDAWLKRLVVEANEAEGTALDEGEVTGLEKAIEAGRIERGSHHKPKDEAPVEAAPGDEQPGEGKGRGRK